MKRPTINYSRLLIFLIFLWTSFMSWYLIFRTYDLNNVSTIDTSTFLQSLLSFFLHKPLINTVPGGSYYSVHASPFLLVILPFIILNKSAATLYIFQSIIIYSAAFPLFLIAKKRLEDDRVAFLLSVTYLFFAYTTDSPFEMVTVFMGLMIYSYYFFDARKYTGFFITFVLTLSTIEFNPIIGVVLGLYLLVLFVFDFFRTKLNAIENKFKDSIKLFYTTVKGSRYALTIYAIIIVSVAFYELDTFIISSFSHGTHNITINLSHSNLFSLTGLLDGFGYDLASKVKSIIFINAPYLFLSLFSPFSVMELPWFLASGVSTFPPYWTLGVYYESYIIPFVALSAIFGMEKLGQWISEPRLRKKIMRRLSYVVFFVNILLFLSLVIGPIVSTMPSQLSQDNSGVSSLSTLIPFNQSVYTGVNELPVVSAHAPDTWYYGPPRNYTLFNTQSGPPYSLAGYGFVAASGSFALYERNYTGNPLFNQFYLNETPVSYNAGCSVSSSFSQFLPLGNYTISTCGTFSPVKSILLNANQGNVSYLFLNDDYVYIYPFSFSVPVTLRSISIESKMTYGVYTVQSMVTTSLEPQSFVDYQCSNYYQYRFKGEQFSYDLQLNANTTYYLWLWSSGDPGGLYFPTHTSTNNAMIGKIACSKTTPYGYKISTVTNLTNTSYGPQIAFYAISNFGTQHPSNLSIAINASSKDYTFDTEMNGSFNSSFNLSITSSGFVNFNVMSGELNGSLVQKIVIKSSTYSFKGNYALEHPYLILSLLSIFSLPLLFLSLVDVKFRRFKILQEIDAIILIVTTSACFLLLGLYYFGIFVDLTPVYITALLLLISFVIYVANYDWFGNIQRT